MQIDTYALCYYYRTMIFSSQEIYLKVDSSVNRNLDCKTLAALFDLNFFMMNYNVEEGEEFA